MTATPASVASKLPETLVLWDVDHTLIENGGVSKATYALAFEMLTGQAPSIRPATDGRTDILIMHELLEANSIDPSGYSDAELLTDLLVKAMKKTSPDLPRLGHVLPGVVEALDVLSGAPAVIQSVLTGNIVPNAHAKLDAFDLGSWFDLEVGGFGSDDIVRSKLVDAARRKVANKYGKEFDRSSTILIGDTVRDVQAAHDGGAKVIAVATGVYSVEQLEAANANVVLENLADLELFVTALSKLRAAPVAA